MSFAYGRVLVTGGAGFIGSHLVARLLLEGARVACLDDFNDFYNPDFKRANISAFLNSPSFRLLDGDIREQGLVESALASFRSVAVVHLAARAGVRPSLSDPFTYQAVNVGGTLNLLEASRKEGVKKFIFGSSSSVYGLNSRAPFREDDPLLKPASPYAATKIAGEALAHAYAHLYDLPTVSLRFFTVYGPRQRPDLAIYKFTKLLLEGRPLPVFGDGSSGRDYTHVTDIVEGIMRALAFSPQPYEVFNLGNSRAVSLSQLIAALEGATGCLAALERLPEQPGDVPLTWADLSKSSQLLGYFPAIPLESGLADFLSWFKRERLGQS